MRLSRIWRIRQIEEGVVHRGACRILHILGKPNSIIVLLFLQNNSKFKNKLKHANLDRCIDNASLSGSLGDKGLFRSANILQTADVVRPQAVLTMFLDNISRWNEWNICRLSRHFVLTTETTQPRPQVFTVNGSITCNQAALLTSFWRHRFNMTKFFPNLINGRLVMVNYACGFNQSDTGKYFEWIIMNNNTE